jgi:hypothetical protein
MNQTMGIAASISPPQNATFRGVAFLIPLPDCAMFRATRVLPSTKVNPVIRRQTDANVAAKICMLAFFP